MGNGSCAATTVVSCSSIRSVLRAASPASDINTGERRRSVKERERESAWRHIQIVRIQCEGGHVHSINPASMTGSSLLSASIHLYLQCTPITLTVAVPCRRPDSFPPAATRSGSWGGNVTLQGSICAGCSASGCAVKLQVHACACECMCVWAQERICSGRKMREMKEAGKTHRQKHC